MKGFFFIFVTVVLFADANHFLGGTISWRPLNESATGSPVDIVITQTYSWAFSIAACTSAMIASNQLVPLTGFQSVTSHRLNCSWNCATGAGGFTAQPVASFCTDFSAPADTTVGQRSDIVRINAGANFSASYQNIFWRNLTSGTNAPWAISTYINLRPRPDNGLYNNAPVATVMSPINIVRGKPTVIHIPVADGDGDVLRCRWARSTNGINECGGICPPGSLPNGTIIFPNCTMIITGPDVGNWFAVALTVEDFINSSSTTALSSAPVQFLVQVVAAPSCNATPDIIGTPQQDSCTAITVGQTITTNLIAINSCGPTVNITDIATLSFPGVLKGNLVRWNSTTYTKSVTWTPTSSQLGYQVMCAMAINSQNAQSDQFCFTFYVSQNPGAYCPGFTTSTTTTTTTSTRTTTATTSTSVSTTTTTTRTTSTTSTSTATTTRTTSVTTTATTTSMTTSVSSTSITTGSSTTSSPASFASLTSEISIMSSVTIQGTTNVETTEITTESTMITTSSDIITPQITTGKLTTMGGTSSTTVTTSITSTITVTETTTQTNPITSPSTSLQLTTMSTSSAVTSIPLSTSLTTTTTSSIIFSASQLTTSPKITTTTATQINWPLLGSLIGVLLLSICGLCGVLLGRLCYKYCSEDGGHFTEDSRPILYHIEICPDPNCRYNPALPSWHLKSGMNRNDPDELRMDSTQSFNSPWSNTMVSFISDSDHGEMTPKLSPKRSGRSQRTTTTRGTIQTANQNNIRSTSMPNLVHESEDDERDVSSRRRSGSCSKSVRIMRLSRAQTGALSQNRLNSSISSFINDEHVHVSRMRSGHNKVMDIQSPKARYRAAKVSASRARLNTPNVRVSRLRSHIGAVASKHNKTNPAEESNELEDLSRIPSGVRVEHVSQSKMTCNEDL